MKKLNLKIDFRSLSNKNKGTVWQKAVLGVLIAILALTVGACGYLFIKPLSAEIQTIIDEEISSVDIIFDQKTINGIKDRQKPADNTAVTTGKNPFAAF